MSTYDPALIVEQTVRGRSELTDVITSSLHVDRIVLPDDALTALPIVTIERRPVRDARGLLINGRDLSRPEIFRLYMFRGDCVLVHSPSGKRWTLRYIKCRSMEKSSS